MSEEIHPEQPLSLEKEGSSEDENLGILSASRAKRDPSLYSRREGDSSDDEKNDESSIVVEEIEDNDGIENGDEEGDGYQALEEEDDDFGDFHGFLQDDAAMKSMLDSAENDNFANFYSSRCQKDLQKSPFPLKSQASAEKKLADNLSLPQNISIPPLSRGMTLYSARRLLPCLYDI